MNKRPVTKEEIAELNALMAKENPTRADFERIFEIEDQSFFYGIEGLIAQPFEGLEPRLNATPFEKIKWFFTSVFKDDGSAIHHNHITEVTMIYPAPHQIPKEK